MNGPMQSSESIQPFEKRDRSDSSEQVFLYTKSE